MRRATLGLIWVAVALAGCAAPAPAVPTTTPLPAPSPTPSLATPAPINVQAAAPAALPASAVRPVASPGPARLPLSLVAGRSGADLRVTLDSLLAENAFLLVTAMQASAAARLDALIGVSSQLDTNTLTLAEIVGALKGPAAADAFAEAWRGQSADLVSYARGQRDASLADLESRRTSIAAQLASGTFSAADATSLLQQREQVELALGDGQDSAGAPGTASLLESSDGLGRPLAAAMASQSSDLSPRSTEGAEIDVRLSVVGEVQWHLLLTGAAIAASADGRSADAQAYAAAAGTLADRFGSTLGAMNVADATSSRLSSADSASLGPAVADRLRTQTAALVSTAGGGDRAQAAQDIDRTRVEIDALLSGANPLLPRGLLAQQLRNSDQPLLTAADAFAARDYATGFARLHEAMHQAQKPADTIAEAIVDRYPARYLTTPAPVT